MKLRNCPAIDSTGLLVRVERRVYVESVGAEPESMRRADIAIVAVDAGPASGLLSQQTASMTIEV